MTVLFQEPIARKVIDQGVFNKNCKVEVYLVELKLCYNDDIENPVTRQFSRADTLGTTLFLYISYFETVVLHIKPSWMMFK